MKKLNVPLVEHVAVPEICIDGIASVDLVGQRIKVAYYSMQRSPDGGMEAIICCRLVLTTEVANSVSCVWNAERMRLIEGVAAN